MAPRSQTRTLPSRLDVASCRAGSCRCAGRHATLVTDFLWPRSTVQGVAPSFAGAVAGEPSAPVGTAVMPAAFLRRLAVELTVAPSPRTRQTRVSQSIPAVATSAASGDQATACTHPLCPSSASAGVCVERSHSRTTQSPPPEHSARPSGENDTFRTLSLCPGRVAVHLVTARTRKVAWGTYLISIVRSAEAALPPASASALCSGPLSSRPSTWKAYGTGSSVVLSIWFKIALSCSGVVVDGTSSCGITVRCCS
mmetsp:Transcript_265/g.782  ORF Transcript_265/g.782 Transcript_265/m.782 type:complete len:254 (-) Transcript_265:170-931(-)